MYHIPTKKQSTSPSTKIISTILLCALFPLTLIEIFILGYDTTCCVNKNINANILKEEYKNKTNHTKGTWGFNMIWPNMPISMNKRKYFYYTKENIAKDITKYNYLVPKIFHVSPSLISITLNHKPPYSTWYFLFFLTFLFTL